MIPRPARLGTAMLTVAAAFPLLAQGPAAADLGHRTARSKYTLGSITAIRELADGRVVVTDIKEGVFRIVDLGRGDVSLIGNQGEEDGDYRRATGLFDLPGDSIGLYDGPGQKLFHLSAQAALGPSGPVPGAAQHVLPLALDASGGVYSRSTQRDSATHLPKPEAWITRLAPGDSTPQPFMPYHLRGENQAPSGNPFLTADAIAIRHDGLGARVVADSYRVIWYRNGKESGRTALVAYEPIPISIAEQQAIKDSVTQMFKALTSRVGGGTPMMIMNPGGASTVGAGSGAGNISFSSNGSSGATTMTVTDLGGGSSPPGAGGSAPAGSAAGIAALAKFDPEQVLGVFPATKPAIPGGGGVAMFDADGHLWVARSRVRGDLVPHYDVFAEDRGLVGRVNLPPGTRLIGFGRGTAYLTRDDEGSDWLERYAMPKF